MFNGSLDKGKCIVCGSNQDWKDILKLEISKENSAKAKTLKDIQVASSKLGFGSYSKFLERCDHEHLLTEINTNPLKQASFVKSKSPRFISDKQALSTSLNEKKFMRNSTSSTNYANAQNEDSVKHSNKYKNNSLLISQGGSHLPIINFSGNNYFTPTNDTYKSVSTKGGNNISGNSEDKTTGFLTKYQITGKRKKSYHDPNY